MLEVKTHYCKSRVHRMVLDLYEKHRRHTVVGSTVELPNLKMFDRNKRQSPKSTIIRISYKRFAFERRLWSKYLPAFSKDNKMTIPAEAVLVFHNYAPTPKPSQRLKSNASESSGVAVSNLIEHLQNLYDYKWSITEKKDSKDEKIVHLFNEVKVNDLDFVAKLENVFKLIYCDEATIRMEFTAMGVTFDMVYLNSDRSVSNKETFKLTVKS